MEEVEITLELVVAEVNAILQALAKQPYEQTAAIIDKVRRQGDEQLAEWQRTQAPSANDAE